MPASFGSASMAGYKYSVYCCYSPGNPPEVCTNTLGNTDILGNTSTKANRRAVQVTATEPAEIESISIYHNGGSGNMLLAVYEDNSGTPGTRIGVTANSTVNGAEGWQTIDLINPVNVNSGQTVWLAWVFENNPGIRYEAGTPARAQSDQTWSGGMPASFGSASMAGYKYSVYCCYSPLIPKSGEKSFTDISEPKTYGTLKVYPNPFSDKLRFELMAKESVNAQIDIYDITGRLIKTIFEQPIQADYKYEAIFEPDVEITGFYIYRVIIGDNITNGKVIFKGD